MKATCVFISRWIDEEVVHIYAQWILLIIKKNELWSFAKTWMNLESIISEISQRKTNAV